MSVCISLSLSCTYLLQINVKIKSLINFYFVKEVWQQWYQVRSVYNATLFTNIYITQSVNSWLRNEVNVWSRSLSAFKARVTLAVLSEFKPRHSRSVDGGSAASWIHGFLIFQIDCNKVLFFNAIFYWKIKGNFQLWLFFLSLLIFQILIFLF